MMPTLTRQSSAGRSWTAVSIAMVGIVATVSIWVARTSTGSLREQLKSLQPWSLDACVLLGLVAAVSVINSVNRDVFRRHASRVAILLAVGVALAALAAPRTNRIFYDEQIYQGVGQNIADVRLAQMCNDGNVEYGRLQCASGEYNKQPYGYPHALSLAYRAFGVHPGTAFAVNVVAMAMTICAVYFLVGVAFRDREAAWFAGLLIALMPEQLLWSATAAVEPTASLAAAVAVLCAVHYVRSGGGPARLAVVVATAYAVQFRPESILILPVVAFVIWPRLRVDLARPHRWWAVVLFSCLVAVHIAHLFAVRHIDWGTTGPRFSFRYIQSNLPVNGWFYWYDERFPVAFTVLGVAGLISVRRRRESWAMAMYFLLFFTVGLVFYAGSYNYGADVRYSLMTYPPLAVLGGLGVAWLARVSVQLATGPRSRFATIGLARAVITTLLLFQFLWYAPVVRATTEEAWAARADVRFAQSFATEIPRNSYVLTHNPSMFHLWGVSAGQMSLVTSNPEYLRLLAQRYSGGLYLHWNFWCNAQDATQQEICRNAFAIAPVDVAKEYRERDQHFVFYRLKVAN
jgi:dolichyl-phosphate-mannose-protein mannosyltransferase